jgi:hypothetical protein
MQVKRSIRRWIKTILQSPLVEMARESRKRSWLRKHSPFGGRSGLRATIGCGGLPLPGWVNIDLIRAPDIFLWDCHRGLPFDDNSVSFIFAEHFFEH